MDVIFHYTFYLISIRSVIPVLIIIALVSLLLVQARVLVVLSSALTRVAMRSAERSRSVLTRACVTESAPSVLPRSLRPTSLLAMEKPKSASTGWVAEDFRPGKTGRYSNFKLVPSSVWSRLSSCSSPAGLLRLHLWEVRSWGMHLCQPRW